MKGILVMVAVLLAATGAATPPSPVEAAQRCIRMVQNQSGKYLLNTCSMCRSVKVSHRRPGGKPPITRTIPLPAKGKTALPFKGPGTTRLTVETPCRETKPLDGSTIAGTAGGQRCVQFARRRDGGLAFYNGCAACRVVVAERTSRTGAKSMETYGLSAGATLALPKSGAPAVKIISDQPCP